MGLHLELLLSLVIVTEIITFIKSKSKFNHLTLRTSQIEFQRSNMNVIKSFFFFVSDPVTN